MDLSGNKLRVLADAIRHRIAWCDSELARAELAADARTTITDDKQALVAILGDLMPARRVTEPGHG